MFDITTQRAYDDFKIWMLWRLDQERKAKGLKPLEEEIADDLRRIDDAVAAEKYPEIAQAA